MRYMIAAILDADETGIPRVQANRITLEHGVNITLAVMGSVAVIVIILAGIKMMISQGDPQKVAAARNTIVYAAVGFVVIAAAGLIIRVAVWGLKG